MMYIRLVLTSYHIFAQMAQNTPNIFNSNDAIQNIATLLDKTPEEINATQSTVVAKDSLADTTNDYLSLSSVYDGHGKLNISAVIKKHRRNLSGTVQGQTPAPAPAPDPKPPTTPHPIEYLDGKNPLSGY